MTAAQQQLLQHMTSHECCCCASCSMAPSAHYKASLSFADDLHQMHLNCCWQEKPVGQHHIQCCSVQCSWPPPRHSKGLEVGWLLAVEESGCGTCCPCCRPHLCHTSAQPFCIAVGPEFVTLSGQGTHLPMDTWVFGCYMQLHNTDRL